MATYGVSRQTIRLALDQLAAHAVIRKVHGSGSYVQFAPPKQKTNQIAVLVYDFQESVFPSIRGKVEETLFQQGYVTVVVSTLGEIDKERQILQRFCENHVDGIILQPEYSSLVSPNLDLIQTLRSLGTKLVFMDSRYPDMSLQDIPCVSMENYSAAYNITIELIRSGHSKIGGIFRLRSAQIKDRFCGVRQAIVDGEIPYSEAAFLLAENTERLRMILNDQTVPNLQQAEAIICGTGEYAPQLVEKLQENGAGNIRTVVFFDEVDVPVIDGISFFTLKYAGEEIGRLCAEKISNEINGIAEESVEVPWITKSLNQEDFL